VTLRGVFQNILKDGYEGHREPLEITFSKIGESTGEIANFSVCYIDGMQRALAILGVLHYMLRLDRFILCCWCAIAC
jgi:hypothetical protein